MSPRLPLFAGLTLGTLVGAAAAVFGSMVPGNPLQAAAFPAAIALIFLLLLDRRTLLLAILALRSAGDVVFEATRFSLGGYQIGVGGVINAIVILLVILLVVQRPEVLPRRALWGWALFLLVALVGVVISPVKADAIRTYLSLLSYCAMFAAAFYLVRSPADFRFCVRIILWSSVIPAIYALVELATGGGHALQGVRLKGTFAHPNIFAFYLVLVMALALYLLKSAGAALSAAARAGLGLYMAVLLALLILTQTRSAWIACFVLFAVYGFFVERRYLVYLFLAPLLGVLLPGVQERLVDLAAGNDEYVQYARLNSFAWRRLIWETGLQWMRPDHYLLGYGLESFPHHSLTFFPLANRATSGFGAHNIYVQVLFELGVIGLFAYLSLFARLLAWIKALYPADRLAAVLTSALVGAYLIVSFSDNMFAYLSFNWYFWFLGGAAAALALAGRAERDADAARASQARPVNSIPVHSISGRDRARA